jgi:hypothetical protein
MSDKLVVYFTAAGHALYRWKSGALELESRFTPDEAGLDDFRAHLRGRRGALVYVLADLAGEDFHEDQIPYLRRRRPSGGRGAAPRAALPRHATGDGPATRHGERGTPQRTAAARLVHQYAAVHRVAGRALGVRRAPVWRVLRSPARARSCRATGRARRPRVRGHRQQYGAAAVLSGRRTVEIRAPRANRGHGARCAGRIRARRRP